MNGIIDCKEICSVFFKFFLSLCLSLIICPPEAVAAEKWGVYEIEMTSQRLFSNAYLDVDVKAEFTGPDNRKINVSGFWDGGRTFKVRFTPTASGLWCFSITSDPFDPGLVKSGNINVREAEEGNHGFVRRSPEYPYYFRFDDGSYYFMAGNTYYSSVGNALESDNWKKAYDGTKRYGMNKVRLLLFQWGATTYSDTEPFLKNSSGEIDHDLLKLKHWRRMDDIVGYLNAEKMVADIILFADSTAHYSTPVQDCRYVRYALSRFAAYPNVTWCLCNEWQWADTKTGGYANKEFWNMIGGIVKDEDPWMSEGEALRPLSIHSKNQGWEKFEFFDASWPTHVILQHNANFPVDCGFTGDEAARFVVLNNRSHEMPVVIDEFGYISNRWGIDRERIRRFMWAVVMHGGFFSTGDFHDRYGSPGADNYHAVWNSADWYDAEAYNDVKVLVDFWTGKGIRFWEMTERSDLIASGSRVYVKADVGNEYVIYDADGGDFQITLESGREYYVSRYNPLNGTENSLGTVKGGLRAFSSPSGSDWVYLIRRNSDQAEIRRK